MLHLSTKDFAGASKVTRWNDIVAEVFTPLETKPFSPEEFETKGRLEAIASRVVLHGRPDCLWTINLSGNRATASQTEGVLRTHRSTRSTLHWPGSLDRDPQAPTRQSIGSHW